MQIQTSVSTTVIVTELHTSLWSDSLSPVSIFHSGVYLLPYIELIIQHTAITSCFFFFKRTRPPPSSPLSPTPPPSRSSPAGLTAWAGARPTSCTPGGASPGSPAICRARAGGPPRPPPFPRGGTFFRLPRPPPRRRY